MTKASGDCASPGISGRAAVAVSTGMKLSGGAFSELRPPGSPS